MKKLLSFIALTGCLLLAPSLNAQELTDQEKANKAYVFGFLAGLQHTETETGAVVKTSEQKVQSEFFQRAYKSRLGREPQRFSSKADQTFCLPESGISDNKLQDMMTKFNQVSLSAQADKAKQLFQMMKNAYPCS